MIVCFPSTQADGGNPVLTIIAVVALILGSVMVSRHAPIFHSFRLISSLVTVYKLKLRTWVKQLTHYHAAQFQAHLAECTDSRRA